MPLPYFTLLTVKIALCYKWGLRNLHWGYKLFGMGLISKPATSVHRLSVCMVFLGTVQFSSSTELLGGFQKLTTKPKRRDAISVSAEGDGGALLGCREVSWSVTASPDLDSLPPTWLSGHPWCSGPKVCCPSAGFQSLGSHILTVVWGVHWKSSASSTKLIVCPDGVSISQSLDAISQEASLISGINGKMKLVFSRAGI